MNYINKFDRELRKADRLYRKNIIDNIEDFCNNGNNDPKQFWKNIKSLGSRKLTEIPMKIKRNIEIIADQEIVLEQWKTDFSGLYNQCNENNEFDEAFYQNIMTIVHERERDMENEHYDENNEINNALTRNEVVAILNKLKYKNACGIDGIPNEILKLPGIVNILTSFLTLCFETHTKKFI